MANGQDEPRRDSLAPPSGEEADRLAEQFRPSWEVDDGVDAQAFESPPAPPRAASAAPRAHVLKQTLVGIQSPQLSSAPKDLGKRTLVGIGLNDMLELVHAERAQPPAPSPSEPPPPQAGELSRATELASYDAPPPKKISSRPPTPVPSDVFDGAAAEKPSRPSNGTLVAAAPSPIAKSYRPKEAGLDVPAVVVAPAALAASEAAARSRSRSSRLRETQTIPTRTASGRAPIPEISFARPRRSKPLWLAIVLGLSVGAAAALSLIWGEDSPEETPTVLDRGANPSGVRAEPAATPAAHRERAHTTAQQTSIRNSQVPPEAPPAAEGKLSDDRSNGAAAARPAQKTTSTPARKPAAPKKPSSGALPATGTPAKSKAVIVRESPF